MKKLSEINLEQWRPAAPAIDHQVPAISQHGNPRESASQQLTSAEKSSDAAGFSLADKAQLTMALSKICEMQKAYGKTAVNLETLVEGFLWVMDGYSMADILGALRIYIRQKNDIPAPADLIEIIDPAPKPLSGAVYVRICKKIIQGTQFVTDEEFAYRKAFEMQEVGKVGGGEYAQCRREIEKFGRDHWGQ